MRCIFIFILLCLPLCTLAESINPSIQGTQNYNVTSHTASQLANRGIELFEQGDYPKAIEYLYEAWKLSPENVDFFAKNLSIAYNNYARELATRKEIDKALQMTRKAIFYDETNSTAKQNLSILYSNKGVNHKNTQTRLTTAQSLRNSGYIEEAVAEYLDIIQLEKNQSLLLKRKLELAQLYQVLFSKYKKSKAAKRFFQAMIKLLSEVLSKSSQNYKAHLILGRGYLVNNQLSESIQSFENVLTLQPSNQSAIIGLTKAWEEVIRIAPNEPDNLIGYGQSLIRSGKREKGNSYLQKAKQIDPTKELIVADTLSNTLDPTSPEFQLIRQAKAEYSLGNLSKSISLYKEAIQTLPPTPYLAQIHYDIASIYLEMQDLFNAQAHANKSLKIHPGKTDSKTLLANIKNQASAQRTKFTQQAIELQSQGKFAEAIQKYQQIIHLNPSDHESIFNLGTAYQEHGDINLALTQYQTALKLAPQINDYQQAVASLQRAINNGYAEEAKSNQIVESAVQLQSQGKLTEAIQKYREAIQLDPDSAQAHFNLATALHSSNDKSLAIIEYEKSFELAPQTYPEAKFFAGNLYEAFNNKSRALESYRRYLATSPNGEYAKLATRNIQNLNNH